MKEKLDLLRKVLVELNVTGVNSILNQIDSDYAEHCDAWEALENERDGLREEYERMKKELDNRGPEIRWSSDRLQIYRLEAENKELREGNARIEKDFNEAEKKIHYVEQQYKELSVQADSLRRQLFERGVERDVLEKRVVALTEQIDTARKINRVLETLNRRQSDRIVEAQDACHKIEKEVAYLTNVFPLANITQLARVAARLKVAVCGSDYSFVPIEEMFCAGRKGGKSEAVAKNLSIVGNPSAIGSWHVDPIIAEAAFGGTKHDENKNRVDLLPAEALEEIAKVLTHGAKKYGDNNWRKGFKWHRIIGAIERHMLAIMRGEDIDPDSKLLHAAHAGCEILFLLSHQLLGIGEDDRWRLKK